MSDLPEEAVRCESHKVRSLMRSLLAEVLRFYGETGMSTSTPCEHALSNRGWSVLNSDEGLNRHDSPIPRELNRRYFNFSLHPEVGGYEWYRGLFVATDPTWHPERGPAEADGLMASQPPPPFFFNWISSTYRYSSVTPLSEGPTRLKVP